MKVDSRFRHDGLTSLVCWLGLGVLAACDDTATEPVACFPVPAEANVMRAWPGVENQGTMLQGDVPFSRPQGTHLQGAQDVSHPQGTQLQGAPLAPEFAHPQGTRLQGRARGPQAYANPQGVSLQGESNIMQQQGTHLQGVPRPATLATGQAGEKEQGRPLQGDWQSRAYRGLADLNGARLSIEADETNAVTLQHGQLVARGFATTASLRGTAISAIAPDGRKLRVEVVALTQDGGLERVELRVDGAPACQPDLHGVFVAGRWDAQATQVDDPNVVTYACMDGVIAKCVDWGYAPWLTDASVHATCTRLARADYCGNGVPWTMDGTLINVFDRLGVQAESSAKEMAFEAAWGPSGALCVAKARYEIQDDAGHLVLPRCFATLPRCSSLVDAAPLGAMLANRSKVMPIEACP